MILLQEGDELAYRCAFACQKNHYVIHTGKTTKDLKGAFNKRQIKEFFKERGKAIEKDYVLESYLVTEKPHIVKHTIDIMVKKLYNLQIENVCTKIDTVKLFLSPSDHSNFRYLTATIPGPKGPGYKAGRQEKPKLLKLVRDRLINTWGAIEISGYEADDALGIYASEDTILSHIDKDINMIPGNHYNHVSGQYYNVPEGLGNLSYNNNKLIGRGLKFFYAQLLMGDSTDNIPGIPKVGPKTSWNLLEALETEEECFNAVYTMYKQYYGDTEARNALKEIASLLWIVRHDRLIGGQYLESRGFI